jgi:crotonobetainyl-CoA:carnitine CoA-transferase CaiB-like acyl-CoA transferase
MPGPMTGVKVVDLTSMVSGPLATMILADQGADVIKVEAPGGDHARHVSSGRGGFSAAFLNNNRNKRSIVLDLKAPEGLEVFMRLAGDADVVIQNFRPGVAARIGVGEVAIREINPSVIYVSIAGFGFSGPYAQKPVFDPLIQALSGLTTVQAGSDEERPKLVRTILPDKLTGVQAAQAIAAALFARERTGEGQHIQLSMLDTLVSFLWSSDMGGHTFVGDEMETERAQSFIDLVYETADGFISVAIQQNKDWQGLARAVDRADLIDDARFQSPKLRERHKNVRMEITQSVLRAFATSDILARLEAQDVPCAPVLTRSAMRAHPQVLANGAIIETEHPIAGKLRQARHPAEFSQTVIDLPTGAPLHGQNTTEVLAEAGYSEQKIQALIASGAAVQAHANDKDG